jgi:hypothetical protein
LSGVFVRPFDVAPSFIRCIGVCELNSPLR